MGILQLVSPVVMISYSLTTAGMQSAISNFVASSLKKRNYSLCRRYLFSGLLFSFFISLLYSLLVYGQAEMISVVFLKEPRCTPLLKILSFSFPLSALHSCLFGYYYGKKETTLPALAQILEQIIRILTVMVLFYLFSANKIPCTISLCCLGTLLGEFASFLLTFFFFIRREKREKPSGEPVLFSLLSYSMPLTFHRVMVNILHSIETVSLPLALRMFGYSQEAALSIYGVFTGMALSLILFPSTFPNSAAVLILPTVAEAKACEDHKKIRSTLIKTVSSSLILGIFFGLIFYLFSSVLGLLLFDSILAGILIRSLSFLCPFLYLHTTLSSILNGLNKTLQNLLINIFSLLLRLAFVMIVIPQKGIDGYLMGLLLSEVISCAFCLLCLRKYLDCHKKI